MTKLSDKTHKWEFGMYPITIQMANRYEKSILRFIKFLENHMYYNLILDDISEIKGLINRIIKKNQLDWFTVYERLDYPFESELFGVIKLLKELRNLLKKQLPIVDFINKEELFLNYLRMLLGNYKSKRKTKAEYLYILSTKNEPDILKIGMTTKMVSSRVNQINSSTGVLNPFGVRKVFKVKNSKQAERDSHIILDEFRIRKDREFFKLPFSLAIDLIEKGLTQNGLKIRNIGQILYYNPINKKGSLNFLNKLNLEFSEKDMVITEELLKIGDIVEYDINIAKKRAFRIIKNTVHNKDLS